VLSFDAYLKFIEDVFIGGQRLDPASDGRPDARPTVRETMLGDLANDFDFSHPQRSALILSPSPPGLHPGAWVFPAHALPWSKRRKLAAAGAAGAFVAIAAGGIRTGLLSPASPASPANVNRFGRGSRQPPNGDPPHPARRYGRIDRQPARSVALAGECRLPLVAWVDDGLEAGR
jgi:hypothetical protein